MSNYEEHSLTVENFHDQVILAAEARDIGIFSCHDYKTVTASQT